MIRTIDMRRGFTMTELLVVILIIVILASLIFPVFAKAKRSARSTQCLSNLSQIGKSFGLYMADYDDFVPAGIDAVDKYRPEIWDGNPEFRARIDEMPLMHEILQPYVKSEEIFRCPLDNGTDVIDNQFPLRLPTSPSLFAQYGSSYFFRTEIALRAFTGTSFEMPADVNVMMDAAGAWHGDGRPLRPGDNVGVISQILRSYRYNVLFGDFHVKSLSRSKYDQAWSTRL